MSKKRGFTLTEVLVVIAITALIMTMLGTTFAFMATSSGTLIHKSEELTQTQSIETYLRGLIAKGTYDIDELADENIVTLDGGYLKVNGKTEFKDTGLKSFRIYKDDNNFVRCELKYDKSEYNFILGLYKQTGTEGE